MKKLLSKLKIGTAGWIILFGFSLIALLGFVHKQQNDKLVQNILINIDYEHDFVGKEEILGLMTGYNSKVLIGQPFQNINLKQLEERIKTHNFVADAEVYKDHKGNLMVDIAQSRPVARIIQQDGPHAYIGYSGNTLPISERYTARVLLIDGSFSQKFFKTNFLQTEEGKPYLDLIKKIDSDKLWKAQITQLTIDHKGEISFYPQVGDQLIEFGKPDDIDKKLEKLKIFYKKIFPYKGYNTYDRVSLKFRDQIVCE